jgi:diguanylate cyclase (GGDEF)-like protein
MLRIFAEKEAFMTKNAKLRKQAIRLYGVVLLLFVLFFVLMGLSDRMDLVKVRTAHSYIEFTDYTMTTEKDPQAPKGIRKVYRLTMPATDNSENCFSFHTVHHLVEIYYGDQLMYSIAPREGNLFAKSPGRRWNSVPVYTHDSGKEVTVIATPLYRNVIDQKITFFIGSHFTVFHKCLSSDLAVLVLAIVCILLGIVLSVVQMYLILKRRSTSSAVFFLGNFSILLGLWRITGTASSDFFFYGRTMHLGYLSTGMLFLCTIPLMLFAKSRFDDFDSAPMLHVSIIISCGTLLALVLQVLGIVDFPEALTLCHFLLLICIATLVGSAFVRSWKFRDARSRRSLHYVLLLAAGATLDFVQYYTARSNDGMVYTMIAFVVYAMILFAGSMVETSTKAYTDPLTGLFNKTRWDELMQHFDSSVGTTAIIMLDLNRLKYTNDTQGHEAGDRMIFNFANIMRNTLPANSIICRWGGDEFTVLLTDTNRDRVERSLQRLHQAVDSFNAMAPTTLIYYAAGFALSTEHPELSLRQLLAEADSQMYQDKNRWYAENIRTAPREDIL